MEHIEDAREVISETLDWGWMSREGVIYIVDNALFKTHGELAVALMYLHYPDDLAVTKKFDEQTYLLRRGWLRIDYECFSWENELSIYQIKELRRQLHKHQGKNFNGGSVVRTMVEAAVKYKDFERYKRGLYEDARKFF
jgi:hypothetical protein